MEVTKESFPFLQQLEKWADDYFSPIFGSHGYVGFVLTVVVALLMPLLLSMLIGKKKLRQRAIPVEVGGEAGFALQNSKFTSLLETPWEGATTLPALFEQSCKKHHHDRFLGTRKVIGKETITGNDGRKFEKLHLGEYQWETYGEVYGRVCNFASGLVKFGHDLDTRVAIFSETRADWFIALQGFLRQNVTVVTMYASLGEDALIHLLNETSVTTLVCDSKQFKKVAAIRSKLETLKHVIYFEEDEKLTDSSISAGINGLKVSSFTAVEKLGEDSPLDPRLPSDDDMAIIMYTSGSTGLPKGVMMTHKNVVATAASVMTVIPGLGRKDAYLAFLPLAHILELEAEIVMSATGVAIGYGSALTLTDTSNKIKKGTKGDTSMLNPTLMAAVPAILDRVRDGVLAKVNKKGGFGKKLFNIAYKRRLAAIEGSLFGAWGIEKVLWDIVIFGRVKSLLGGKIRYIMSGGAPLSGDSQRFINICMGAPIGQAYGLTETCAGGTFSETDDPAVGRVGPPLPCCYVKLVSWEEGGYRTSDKPMPRGEIVIGGPSVTTGYFNNIEKTSEVFKVDEKGTRWFYTGDIGQFHPDGCLEIIDRKKDIVKLQHGEYVSLGKVEAALASSNYVDNLMVYADPFHNNCVALVIPSHRELEKWAKESGIEYKDFAELCNNSAANKEVLKSLNEAAKAGKLERFEVPAKIQLLPDPWTPESGLVTTAFKIKREPIKAKFNDVLQNLYK